MTKKLISFIHLLFIKLNRRCCPVFLLGFLLGTSISFLICSNIQLRSNNHNISYITAEEFHQMRDAKASFVLYVGRSSCQYCAITFSILSTLTDLPVDIKVLDLEPYYGTEQYQLIKDELGISYVPAFFYFDNAQPKYFMNSPVSDTYFNSDKNRDSELNKVREKIIGFIDGAAGLSLPINEAPQKMTVSPDSIEISNDSSANFQKSIFELR